MYANQFIRVAKEVAKCPMCKNEQLDGDNGTLSCDEHHITRTCPCGFIFSYDIRNGVDRPSVRRHIQGILKRMREQDFDGRRVEFTGKVGATRKSFMLGGELHTAWYTQLTTTNGNVVTINDAESPVGMMEAETRYLAIKKGNTFLEKVRKGREQSVSIGAKS